MNCFDLKYGLLELPTDAKIVKRRAAKAIVLNDNSVLMVLTNKGDYKFPGGGYKNSENAEQCLLRELLEETGYLLVKVEQCLGSVIEQNPDKFEEDCFFSMESEYYLCTIDESMQHDQMLDDYEREQSFKPIFVDIQEAVDNNEGVILDNDGDINAWVQRETDVLKHLLQWKEGEDE